MDVGKKERKHETCQGIERNSRDPRKDLKESLESQEALRTWLKMWVMGGNKLHLGLLSLKGTQRGLTN